MGSLRAGLHITLHQNTLTNCIPLFDFLSCYSSLLCFVLLTKAIVYSFFCYVKSFSVKYFPNVFQNILFLSSAAEFIFLCTSTRTLYSHIICIICIYNITCISGFSRLGNIYIICIIRTIYIINISLLWTNCGHRPHPFTANIIPYFKVQ